jgi:hypothetical protein
MSRKKIMIIIVNNINTLLNNVNSKIDKANTYLKNKNINLLFQLLNNSKIEKRLKRTYKIKKQEK